MPDDAHVTVSRKNVAAVAAIVLTSASLGLLVSWRAPGLELYTRDMMMQQRGSLPVPDDIAIVAIDEPSIAHFGRFPWPRSLTARAIDSLAAAQAKVIAVDVLYVEPSTETDDAALARSIARAGNVVVAAQLVESSAAGGAATWLEPLPAIGAAAAGVGHVNVSTEAEGIGRQVMVREADDSGRALRAMAVEAIRVADRIPPEGVIDTPGQLLLGKRPIPVETAAHGILIAHPDGSRHAADVLRAARVNIDYIGPAGAFASQTYSFADVVEGRVPANTFVGKYVLIGATAASLGDRLASPFVHQPDVRADQHGALMPGVEVLANSLNTILRSRFYSETPDWVVFAIAAIIAGLTLTLLSAAQGRFEGLKQCAALAALAAGIVIASYFAFLHLLVFPPLTAGAVSFASAGLLALLRRTLATGSRLDATIAQIARSGASLEPESPASAVAESIARLTGASGVAIFAGEGAGYYRLAGSTGLAVAARLNGGRSVPIDFGAAQANRFFDVSSTLAYETVLLPLEQAPGHPGMLVLAHGAGVAPAADAMLLSAAMAAASCDAGTLEVAGAWWPRGVEWKAQALARLNQRLLERARFVDLALRSVEDGLIIASADGRITFTNPRAAEILGSTAQALAGRDLLERLGEAERGPEPAREIAVAERRGTLARLLLDRAAIEREITIGDARRRHYVLRLAAVTSPANGRGPVLGLVASLSDITRQHELQQTKNDVVALVSHEMRTPLTAIQGMSELLAQYEMDPQRRREMYQAINDEAKRLGRMTGEYLDIARLESGATVLRRSPVRIDALLERTLLLLEPLASERGIRLSRDVQENVRPLLADADLLARAVGNLVSNAIKYSPRDSEVVIRVRSLDPGVTIEVIDRGYGISAADLGRVFEKFYRVPRVQDAGTPGTGLGLALVREIAELHGGSVSVASTVNAGSTFTLCLPEPEV
jgi:PAS domain S-box-containing protein